MKQKLGLACCLVKSPEMLILDEPTVGVDPLSRRDLWDIVYTLVEKDGIGVVLSTAYLDEAERCHHVVLMDKGNLIDEGPPNHFCDGVNHRVYLITPPADVKPRDTLSFMAGRADVVDATIRSGRIRTVFHQDVPGHIPDLPEAYSSEITPVTPVFEDAFVDRLVSEGAGQKLQSSVSGSTAGNPDTAEPEIVVHVAGLQKKIRRLHSGPGNCF
jgi:ABC-2 type transport system ATP-binding protein